MKRIFLTILILNTTLIFSQDIYSELNLKKKQWVDSVYNSLSLEEKIAQLFINWVSPEQSDFEEIKKKYSKDYNEIKINTRDKKNNSISDNLYPDIIFGNYGEIVMIGEVETSLEPLELIVSNWRDLQKTNISLIIFVPKDKLKDARDICWNNQLIEKVKVSTFSVEIPIS